MGSRPLRQHYGGVDVAVGPAAVPAVEPWLRHRQRFIDALRDLTEEQWRSRTRCTAWDARDVIAHLVAADGFWVLSMNAARAGHDPTTFLVGFDPSSSLDPFVEATRDTPTPDLFERFVASTDEFVECVQGFGAGDWSGVGESPFGHLENRYLFTHAFWDSWLHERDIFCALGLAPPVELDELFPATWFTLFVGGVQGGLLDDTAPVGAGPSTAIDVTVRFDEFDDALRVRIDERMRIDVADAPDAAHDLGSALDLVERFSGRRPIDFSALPHAELAAQLGRAAQIL
jgi:uncharacterized protein (TIGR03083 family)